MAKQPEVTSKTLEVAPICKCPARAGKYPWEPYRDPSPKTCNFCRVEHPTLLWRQQGLTRSVSLSSYWCPPIFSVTPLIGINYFCVQLFQWLPQSYSILHMAEEVNDLESHKHCIIIMSVIKPLMVCLKYGRGKSLSRCSLMLQAALCNFIFVELRRGQGC